LERVDFHALFTQALETAAQNADAALGFKIPRNFQIVLHAAPFGGRVVRVETAVDTLYLGKDSSYFIIDVAVVEVSRTETKVFVRVSGHPPVEPSNVWTGSDGKRLFKQLAAFPVKVSDASDAAP